jgi:hypothetical protein
MSSKALPAKDCQAVVLFVRHFWMPKRTNKFKNEAKKLKDLKFGLTSDFKRLLDELLAGARKI